MTGASKQIIQDHGRQSTSSVNISCSAYTLIIIHNAFTHTIYNNPIVQNIQLHSMYRTNETNTCSCCPWIPSIAKTRPLMGDLSILDQTNWCFKSPGCVVNGCEILLMEEILHRLISTLSYIFARFYTSQVVEDFFHQQYDIIYGCRYACMKS